MKFFHLANIKYEGAIPPTVGPTRHDAEDPRAVGKAVVWLSDAPMVRSDAPMYQYEVELDPADPNLCEDEPFKQSKAGFEGVFSSEFTLGWYFYFGDVPIVTRRTWDAKAQKYVI